MTSSKREEFLVSDFLVEEAKISKSYNKENAISYLIIAMELITEKEKILSKLDKVNNTVVWINYIAQVYQECYNVAIKEQFYELNRNIGRELVEGGIDRDTFKKLKKAIEAYLAMLTTLESKIKACL